MEIITEKKENEYRFFLKNNSNETVCLDEIVVLSGNLPFERETHVYCDGFNMLSQYMGTVGNIKCMSMYDDSGHYKLPQKNGYFTGYNYALFFAEQTSLWGFTSCKRFCGEIRFNLDKYEIVEKLFNIPIKSGETIELESFLMLNGEKNDLLNYYSSAIQKNHPPRKSVLAPTGWCSWYCFGPDVTGDEIEKNMSVMKNYFPFMKYILIDDGYQNKMGDWLDEKTGFGNMKEICANIIASGASPAIWIAPFIAEKESNIIKEHPEYFVSDKSGKPLSSAEVSFGGWRCAPWYMIDGTNPEAVEHVKSIFIKMKNEYGCNCFKLDANMWGALPFGDRYDNTKTPIEAYRMVMQAICEAVGEDGFVLGCNAPMWASLGLVNGMRTSGDVARNIDTFALLAKENLFRSWQNNKLWLCDPDCITISNNTKKMIDGGGNVNDSIFLNEEEFTYCAAYVFASGAKILFSGDDMTTYTDKQIDIINRLKDLDNDNMHFENDQFEVCYNEKYYVFLNDSELEKSFDIKCEKVKDFFSNKVINTPIKIPAHSGKIIQLLN